MISKPVLSARALTKQYGSNVGCDDITLDLYPGEVVAVVGESGSGKSTLLSCLASEIRPTSGSLTYRPSDDEEVDLLTLSERQRRVLRRTEWGYVSQDARQNLRMDLSAGANISERLLAGGERHYGRARQIAEAWMDRVELGVSRIDDVPRTFSGGMRQRLQIAKNLVTRPRLLFMDEPTTGLDVSVQARLLDLIRSLVADIGVSVLIVTHDLGVARLLSHRIIVMKEGRQVEAGLTDQVLEDPQQPYTQLLVASVLAS